MVFAYHKHCILGFHPFYSAFQQLRIGNHHFCPQKPDHTWSQQEFHRVCLSGKWRLLPPYITAVVKGKERSLNHLHKPGLNLMDWKWPLKHKISTWRRRWKAESVVSSIRDGGEGGRCKKKESFLSRETAVVEAKENWKIISRQVSILGRGEYLYSLLLC